MVQIAAGLLRQRKPLGEGIPEFRDAGSRCRFKGLRLDIYTYILCISFICIHIYIEMYMYIYICKYSYIYIYVHVGEFSSQGSMPRHGVEASHLQDHCRILPGIWQPATSKRL